MSFRLPDNHCIRSSCGLYDNWFNFKPSSSAQVQKDTKDEKLVKKGFSFTSKESSDLV